MRDNKGSLLALLGLSGAIVAGMVLRKYEREEESRYLDWVGRCREFITAEYGDRVEPLTGEEIDEWCNDLSGGKGLPSLDEIMIYHSRKWSEMLNNPNTIWYTAVPEG